MPTYTNYVEKREHTQKGAKNAVARRKAINKSGYMYKTAKEAVPTQKKNGKSSRFRNVV